MTHFDFKKVLKYSVLSLAILNLIALFGFNYALPIKGLFQPAAANSSSADTPSTSEAGNTNADDANSSGYRIVYSDDPLIYDGTAPLNLQEGVSVLSPDGTTAEAELFVSIVTADTLQEKLITYSCDTPNGQISATRHLQLPGYKGPSIVLPQQMPSASEEQLDGYLSQMPTDGTFLALDGYDNAITDKITYQYTIDPADPTKVHMVFSVTNLFNDVCSVAADLTIPSNRPILVLKQQAVTIPKGSIFQPLNYVAVAADRAGNSLSRRIRISGTVDVNTPGTYVLTLTTSTTTNDVSLPQTLTVTVQ